MAVPLVAAFLLVGCSLNSSYYSSDQAVINEEDAPPVVQFKRTLGEKWYGIYYLGVKVGWAAATRRIRPGPDGDVFEVQWKERMHLQIYGAANVVEITGKKEFEGKPPYDLLACHYKEKENGYTREIKIVKKEDKYWARGRKNGKTLTWPVDYLGYTLEDELTLELWAQKSPKMEDTIPFRYLSDDMLDARDSHAYIRDVVRKSVNGGDVSFYEMMEYHSKYDLLTFNYREDGVLLEKRRGCFSKSESENREKAMQMDPTVDLYVRAMVPVEQKIGRADEIKRVRLALEGLDFDLLSGAPGQVVENDSAGNRVTVVIDPVGSPGIRATPAEISRFSESTAEIPSDHPRIVDMARKAVGDEKNRGAQVALLAKFVEEYIEDEYVFTAELIDLIEDKRGDCTEHAMLFAALARSLDIPCREVGGLVYFGDWCMGFGMHAWNEVVIDGYWTPVDASVGASPIDPYYIRFPENAYKESRIISTIPHMKIEVMGVDKKM